MKVIIYKDFNNGNSAEEVEVTFITREKDILMRMKVDTTEGETEVDYILPKELFIGLLK
jgi:hypothetical protein